MTLHEIFLSFCPFQLSLYYIISLQMKIWTLIFDKHFSVSLASHQTADSIIITDPFELIDWSVISVQETCGDKTRPEQNGLISS